MSKDLYRDNNVVCASIQRFAQLAASPVICLLSIFIFSQSLNLNRGVFVLFTTSPTSEPIIAEQAGCKGGVAKFFT